MSDFNYKKYLKNNPLLQKTEVNEEKLITEAKTTTEEMSNPVMRKGEKGDDSIEKETEKMRMKEVEVQTEMASSNLELKSFSAKTIKSSAISVVRSVLFNQFAIDVFKFA